MESTGDNSGAGSAVPYTTLLYSSLGCPGFGDVVRLFLRVAAGDSRGLSAKHGPVALLRWTQSSISQHLHFLHDKQGRRAQPRRETFPLQNGREMDFRCAPDDGARDSARAVLEHAPGLCQRTTLAVLPEEVAVSVSAQVGFGSLSAVRVWRGPQFCYMDRPSDGWDKGTVHESEKGRLCPVFAGLF